ncbi:MAG: hypothetical protein Q9218_004704 [Villophora microphyllina]
MTFDPGTPKTFRHFAGVATKNQGDTKKKEPYRYGTRYSSTLLVGPSKESFGAHEPVLRSSPILARMCSQAVKDGGTPQIDLPYANPDEFALLLEFQYAGGFESLSNEEKLVGANDENRTKALEQLRRIYSSGEKYQLLKLKQYVIGRFADITNLDKFPLIFLRMPNRCMIAC